jgi:dihydroneopterin aldolase
MVPVRRPSATQFHRVSLTDREALVFEAGVKLGGVFHQYLGIPVTSRTAPGLARSIERAIALQPFVTSARVRIDPKRGRPVGRGPFAYRYLTAEMLYVRVTLHDGPVEVIAELRHRPALRYSLMSVTDVRDRRARQVRSSSGA